MNEPRLHDRRFELQAVALLLLVVGSVFAWLLARGGDLWLSIPLAAVLVAGTIAVFQTRMVRVDDTCVVAYGILPWRRRIPWSDVRDIAVGHSFSANTVAIRCEDRVLELTRPAVVSGARTPDLHDEYTTLQYHWSRWRRANPAP